MCSVLIQLNRKSPASIRSQIAEAYALAIRDGRLTAGSTLPSVRALSGRLGVSPLTVAAAYRELCLAGLARALPRSGFRVSAGLASVGGARAQFALNRLEPDLRIHPVAECAQLIAELASADPGIGAYADFQGDRGLREAIAEFDRDAGIASDPEAGLLITSGAQQALSLYARSLAKDACVAVEDPCYPGARLAFTGAGARLVAVRMGDDGPDDPSLAMMAVPGRVAAFYCCPTYANPSGRSWSEAARRRLMAAAQQGGFVVVEDDFMGDLDYLGEAPTRLAALARDYPGVRVLRIRTFSKTLLPALRLAGVAGEPELIARLLALKVSDDLGCSAFLQRALAEFIRRGRYREHLERVRPRYREVRTALRSALSELDCGLDFDDPAAGFCLLGHLAPGVGVSCFVAECASRGLSISPGSDYWIDPSAGEGRFRISFGQLALDEIAPVVALLATAAAAASDSTVNRSLL